MLEALLKPAVSAFANENHITFAQAAGIVGSAVDTLVAYNRVDNTIINFPYQVYDFLR